ncbi:hypothetical protein ACG92U_03085 [Leuconostoc citreum]
MITGVASISADDNTSQGASTADKNKGIDVAVDHSKLDDAVKQAEAAGVKVSTKNPKVITSNAADLEKNQKQSLKITTRKSRPSQQLWKNRKS